MRLVRRKDTWNLLYKLSRWSVMGRSKSGEEKFLGVLVTGMK
jgi:hypothetical protein